jgi:hypothetical protein
MYVFKPDGTMKTARKRASQSSLMAGFAAGKAYVCANVSTPILRSFFRDLLG